MEIVTSWTARKEVGDAHEARVRYELEQRGWTVAQYGQALLPEQIRRALKVTDSAMRWDPDLVAACGSYVCLVDAKAAMRGADAHRYNISRKALKAHLAMFAMLDLPIYYVFSNLGVATAVDVMQYCRLTAVSQTSGYVSLPAGVPVPFDEVFGSPTPAAQALRAA